MLSVLGVIELILIVLILAAAIILRQSGGFATARWLFAVAVCLAAAAAFSPADPMSQIVLFIPMFAAIVLGSRLRLFDVRVAS
ncbi:hypothetical protein [Rubripirellula reticaptiva]|uniref:Uncharacterized protein n=1 Tax=Rubripirellula reticaptiva TaxID=2528013 RepID=A0A5C6EXS4_9BACT|nr:hypothetical protein [Rubripirellula reticaptiva]TWU52021.1 hypothetical protein Poly59_36180 [Rubripirellula reticaptiva]